MTRKPNRGERPHATLIESGEFIKGVKGAAVRIAGTVGKLLQLAKNCDIGLCASHSLQLRQSGDEILAQKLKQHSGGKDSGAHNAIVPPWKSFNRKNYSIMREPCHISRRIGQIAYLSTLHDYVGICLTRFEEDPYDLNLLVKCYLIAVLHLRYRRSVSHDSSSHALTRALPSLITL